MLKYSNTKRRDPDINNYIIKCSLTITSIFLAIFLFNNYSESIFTGLIMFYDGVLSFFSWISNTYDSSINFMKPMFLAVGVYILWTLAFVCLCTQCVFTKIKPDCLASNTQWQKICHGFAIGLSIYCIMYLSSLDNISENSTKAQLAALFLFVGVFSNFYIVFLASARRENDILKNQNNN